METTKTIVETTTQIVKTNGIYDVVVIATDDVITEIKASITAQISEPNGLGGETLSAQVGTITQTEKGITIDGTIPSDMLSAIVTEFINITNEIKQ